MDGRPLLLGFRRLYRFCRRTFGWLVNLELFFQLLNQRWKLLLSFRFDLLPQAFVPLFGVPGCSAIQIERVPAGSGGGLSREAPRRSRA